MLKVPSEKIILTFAGGAYDWRETSTGQIHRLSAGYQYCRRKKARSPSIPMSANLHFTYMDKDSLDHTIYFTDAATNFNVIRMADDWATGGVALWRWVPEDPRLWTFFQKNLSIDSLKKTGIDMKAPNHGRFK
jgi:spore germination protein YaaH